MVNSISYSNDFIYWFSEAEWFDNDGWLTGLLGIEGLCILKTDKFIFLFYLF